MAICSPTLHSQIDHVPLVRQSASLDEREMLLNKTLDYYRDRHDRNDNTNEDANEEEHKEEPRCFSTNGGTLWAATIHGAPANSKVLTHLQQQQLQLLGPY